MLYYCLTDFVAAPVWLFLLLLLLGLVMMLLAFLANLSESLLFMHIWCGSVAHHPAVLLAGGVAASSSSTSSAGCSSSSTSAAGGGPRGCAAGGVLTVQLNSSSPVLPASSSPLQ